MKTNSMKLRLALVLGFAWLAAAGLPTVYAQQANATTLEQVRQAQAIEALKTELESLRQKRDGLVNQRWQEKQKNAAELQTLQEQWESRQSQLENLTQEVGGLNDELRAVQGETSGLNQQVQAARERYLSIGDHEGRLDEWLKGTGAPSPGAERISQTNQLRSRVLGLKDQPVQGFNLLVDAMLKDIARTTQIEYGPLRSADPNLPSGEGQELRMGDIFALRTSSNYQTMAVLLQRPSREGTEFQWETELDPALRQQFQMAMTALSKGDSTILLVPVDPLLSPKVKTAQDSKAEETLGQFILRKIAEADIVGWPITILFVFGMILIIERVWTWLRLRTWSSKPLYAAVDAFAQGNSELAEKLLKGSGAAREVLSKIAKTKSRPEAERQAQEGILALIPRTEKRLNTLGVLATAAPLLGLLGTVIGMIELFQVLHTYGSNDPKLMAKGIAIALVATELGLLTAIPILMIHTFLRNRMDALISQIDYLSNRMINSRWKDE